VRGSQAGTVLADKRILPHQSLLDRQASLERNSPGFAVPLFKGHSSLFLQRDGEIEPGCGGAALLLHKPLGELHGFLKTLPRLVLPTKNMGERRITLFGER